MTAVGQQVQNGSAIRREEFGDVLGLVLQRPGLIERASVSTGGRPRLIAVHPDGDAVLVANEAGWVDFIK